jgi:hypothetical protein
VISKKNLEKILTCTTSPEAGFPFSPNPSAVEKIIRKKFGLSSFSTSHFVEKKKVPTLWPDCENDLFSFLHCLHSLGNSREKMT